MNNRRDFLKYFFGGAAYLTLSNIPVEAWAKKEVCKITILHTNDVHSHIDPFPDNDPKYPGMGGVARRATLIKQIKAENLNTLLLDAGDIFQGTPYFNIYKGELEFKLMSMLNYDASTIGNHDFDNGIEGLVKPLQYANFPMINANYDFSDTAMAGKTIPNKIFIKDGIKIGVFGLGIELEGLVSKKNYENTRYLDPMAIAANQAHYLKKEMKCDLVICLSHLGYKYADDKKISDVVLAKHSKNIDLIVGAHTHTFLEKPHVISNRDRKEVWIVQAGWAGINLGRIDFYFEKNSRTKKVDGYTIKISKNAIVG
jgi:5'-nucleotidase